jgi:hypothetical protein
MSSSAKLDLEVCRLDLNSKGGKSLPVTLDFIAKGEGTVLLGSELAI